MQSKNAKKFVELIKTKKKIIIFLHNNPDPDSLGSALGIKYIINHVCGSKVSIAHGGIIGRAENKEMVRLLKIKLSPIDAMRQNRFRNVIMLDTQPKTGNNMLSNKLMPMVVIDHHPLRKITQKAEHYDVRPKYGSTSTIVLEYLKELGMEIDKRLATALFYGIKSDTDDLGRNRSKADNDAVNYLYPLISPLMLSKIQHPRIPKEYYYQFSEAINKACIIKDVVLLDMDMGRTPDMIAEMSDFFLRMKGIKWVLSQGIYNDGIYFSIRTTSRGLRAGSVAMKVARGIGAAGGHQKAAGGYINISDMRSEEVKKLSKTVGVKFFKAIKRELGECKRIVNDMA